MLNRTQELSPRLDADSVEGIDDAEDENVVTLVVPDGMEPGYILLVELDDGEEIEVPIPADLHPGDEFEILVGPSNGHESVKEPPTVPESHLPIEAHTRPQEPVAASRDDISESAGRELRTAAQRDDLAARTGRGLAG